MPSRSKRAVRAGYELETVSIRQLFESSQTREPSENALRERANRGILVFVESVGNTNYYDRQLSVIRVNAARACKRPGVKWSHIANCVARRDLATPGKLGLRNRSTSSYR